ncbi:MAG: exodeoxyribonuclease VII small subunit [Chloroflexota bacterium]
MPKTKTPTFEESFDELEQAVQQLEAGDLPLEESIGLYERGMMLAAQLEKQLAEAELRVRKLQPSAVELAAGDADDDEIG